MCMHVLPCFTCAARVTRAGNFGSAVLTMQQGGALLQAVGYAQRCQRYADVLNACEVLQAACCLLYVCSNWLCCDKHSAPQMLQPVLR